LNKIISHIIVPTDKGIILIRRTKKERGKVNVFPHWWDIPGGLSESEELPKDAAIRECKEEIGLDVTINKIIGEDSNFDNLKKTVYTRLVYLANEVDIEDEQEIQLNVTEHDKIFFLDSLKHLKKDVNIVPYVSDAISKVLTQ